MSGDAAGGGGVTYTLMVQRDTWLRQQFPDQVHGSDGDLRTGSGSTTSRANRLLVEFEFSTLPSTCQVSQAQLHLYFFQDDFTGKNPTLSAHRVTAHWSEGAATWNDRTSEEQWNSPGGDFDSNIESSVVVQSGQHGWLVWDLTSLVSDWASGAVADQGVEVLEANDNQGNQGRKEFYSSSASQDRPYLTVACQ